MRVKLILQAKMCCNLRFPPSTRCLSAGWAGGTAYITHAQQNKQNTVLKPWQSPQKAETNSGCWSHEPKCADNLRFPPTPCCLTAAGTGGRGWAAAGGTAYKDWRQQQCRGTKAELLILSNHPMTQSTLSQETYRAYRLLAFSLQLAWVVQVGDLELCTLPATELKKTEASKGQHFSIMANCSYFTSLKVQSRKHNNAHKVTIASGYI